MASHVVTTTPTVTITALPNAPGADVLISVSVDSAGFATSAPATLTVRMGKAKITISVDDSDDSGCGGGFTATYHAGGTGISGPYTWTVTGTDITVPRTYQTSTGSHSEDIPQVQNCAQATRTVRVSATDVCTGGTVSSTTISIVVSSGTRQPNGDCLMCHLRPGTTGTLVLGFDVFPNPTQSGELHIRPTGAAGQWQAELFDRLGQVRGRVGHPTGEAVLSTAGLPAGLYHLVITDAGGAVSRHTIEVR